MARNGKIEVADHLKNPWANDESNPAALPRFAHGAGEEKERDD
jgi:hypothetical protein